MQPHPFQGADKLMLVRGAIGGEAPTIKAAGGSGAAGYVQGATALKGDLAGPAPLRVGGVESTPANAVL